jgi:hypothetical protein
LKVNQKKFLDRAPSVVQLQHHRWCIGESR